MDYEKSILQALEMVGQFIMREAVMNITDWGNVDTGTLRNSISYRVNPEDQSVEIGVFAGTAASNYAPYIEFGTGIYAQNGDGRKTPWRYQDRKGQWHTTRGMFADVEGPHPFLGPALRDNEQKIDEIFMRALLHGMGGNNDD